MDIKKVFFDGYSSYLYWNLLKSEPHTNLGLVNRHGIKISQVFDIAEAVSEMSRAKF